MGKIFAAIGGALASFKALSWLIKPFKLLKLFRKAIKEGREAWTAGKDIVPVGKELYREAALVKFGNTSPENIKQMETVARVAIRAAKEMQEAGKELKDLRDVFSEAKAIIG